MYSEQDQARFIEEEMKAWIREDVTPTLTAAIRKRQKHIPEATAENLKHEVDTLTGNAIAEYMLMFQDSGRHVDMKKLTFDRAPIQPGNNFILAWARKKGRKAFRKGVPGYTKNSKSKLTEDQQLERIASAIIMAKKQGKKHRRRGQWYNKTMYALVDRLYTRLVRNQADYFAGIAREDIEKAFTSTQGPFKFKAR